MTVLHDCPALPVARRAEERADIAANHSLALYEDFGKFVRTSEQRHNEVRMRFTTLQKLFEDRLSVLERSVRVRLESVPDIVQEEITGHGIQMAARRWHLFTGAAWTIVFAIVKALALVVSGALGWELIRALMHMTH